MKSKYTEAFDSLKSDENTKKDRADRVFSAADSIAESEIKPEKKKFWGKRSFAILTAAVVAVSAVAVIVPFVQGGGLLNAISKLKDTYVDMDGIAAFGVWNPPESPSASATITDVSYVNASFASTVSDDGVISDDWNDEERYDWESDYDWDPTKANVLISISEDGKIDEVVYERTNGRGQIRQDTLGNAAMVYVSDGFTYVMYVDDQEWEFWKEINFAQEMRSPSGFHCHHEHMQTIVIHNATGKVFPLKDLIPQVSELTGATNYTMQVDPFWDDFLTLLPLYGNHDPLWFSVYYDETSESIRYEYVLPKDKKTSISAARRDKYGQFYLLAGSWQEYRGTQAGIVNLPTYTRYGKSILFSSTNGVMLGTDGRAYTFDEGKLKVFGDDFALTPVEEGLSVAFEGIACDFLGGRWGGSNNGIAYRLENGYLFSMFGEVWKVDSDATLHALEKLEGSFPHYADEGFLINGEIIAFVDTRLNDYGNAPITGRMVRIRFDSSDETPRPVIDHIMKASEMDFHNHRLVVEQNENPYTMYRGETKYFLITVQDGEPIVDYFGYGTDGGISGLTKPITEPLNLS